MKIAFAVFLFVHGLAHGVGALTVSGIVQDENNPSDPTFVLTGFDPSHWIFKLMALIWLLPLLGFVLAGIGVIQEADWALTAIVVSTALSTILSLIWVKAAPFGLVANLIIIAVLLIPWANDRMVPPIDA